MLLKKEEFYLFFYVFIVNTNNLADNHSMFLILKNQIVLPFNKLILTVAVALSGNFLK